MGTCACIWSINLATCRGGRSWAAVAAHHQARSHPSSVSERSTSGTGPSTTASSVCQPASPKETTAFLESRSETKMACSAYLFSKQPR